MTTYSKSVENNWFWSPTRMSVFLDELYAFFTNMYSLNDDRDCKMTNGKTYSINYPDKIHR